MPLSTPTTTTYTTFSLTASAIASVTLNANESGGISVIGGIGGVVGISVGSLVLVSVAIFLCYRRPKSRTRPKNLSTMIDRPRQPADDNEDDDFTQSNYNPNNHRAPSPISSYSSLSPQVYSPIGSPAMRAATTSQVGGQGSVDSYISQPVRPFGSIDGQTRPNVSTAIIYDRVEDLASSTAPLLSNNPYDMYHTRQSSRPLPSPLMNHQMFSQYESIPNLTMQLLSEEPSDENIRHPSTVSDSANRRYSDALSQAGPLSATENTSDTDRNPSVTNTGDVEQFGYNEKDTSFRNSTHSLALETVVRLDGTMTQIPNRNLSKENEILSVQAIKPESKRSSF